MRNYSNPRNPTPQELKALFDFEFDAVYDMDVIGEGEAIREELARYISNALIAVFDVPETGDKLMQVTWFTDMPQLNAVYLWQGGKLAIVRQNDDWLEERRSVCENELLD